jgi:hypothetical protein
MTFVARSRALILLLAAMGWGLQGARPQISPPTEPPLEWVGPETGQRSAPAGRVSRMDETLSRIKNGAVNDGNTDSILPVRVRTRAEDVGRTLESSGS